MKKEITKKDFVAAESRMNKILAVATSKGGFNNLTSLESNALAKNTQIVQEYESVNFSIPMPESIGGLLL